MLAKMKTGTKVLAGFGFATAVTVVTGIVGYVAIYHLSSRVAEFTDKGIPSIQGLDMMRESQLSVGLASVALTHSRMNDEKTRAAYIALMEASLKKLDEGREKFATIQMNADKAAMWKECIPLLDAWVAAARKVAEAVQDRSGSRKRASKPTPPE